MRKLLKLSREKSCKINRFSILTLKLLDRVHAEYTPEELAFVPMVLQMPGADVKKASAGRALERRNASPERYKAYGFLDGGTIACVSGFLFNMVDRSVKLISPCKADERWPLGYRIYAEETFFDAGDLRAILDKMIAEHMPTAVRPTDRIRFRRDLHFEALPDGFTVATRFLKRKFCNDPFIAQLGEVIHRGENTAEQIALQFMILGIPKSTIFETLNLLQSGVLDDEPEPRQTGRGLVVAEPRPVADITPRRAHEAPPDTPGPSPSRQPGTSSIVLAAP